MLLEFKNVDNYYGDLHVLKDVNYSIEKGEIVCLLGGNACGKSTTMKTIMGVVRPRNGSVVFDGQEIHTLSTAERVKRGIAPVLEARRLDYQDADDLHRLDGAEAPDYREAGLPPPSNRTLVTPLELRRIPGWCEALADRSDADLMRLFTTGWVVTFNVNTAPADALRIVPGVDAGTSARIVALRAKAPFVLEWQFIRDFQLPIDPFQPVTLLGAGSGTLSLWHNAGGPVDLLHWTLTPADAGGRPWRLDYEITLPSDEIADPNLVRPAPSPLLSTAPAPGP